MVSVWPTTLRQAIVVPLPLGDLVGVITGRESEELASVAEAMGLSEQDVRKANQAFVLALAHEALEDGKVSSAERAEPLHVVELLNVNAKVVPALLDRAEIARQTSLSTGLRPLPAASGEAATRG